ncbi:MAG: hypothetical protein LC623_05675 [Halobacteriales archaeon]|nr:hypothetical protein [Halobacteriales archaeon]
MSSTPGKDAVVRWVQETVAGTTPANPALKLFSKETLKCSLKLDIGQQESMDIGNVDVEDLFSVQNDYDIVVECHLCDVDRILDFVDRAANNTLNPYTLEYIPDVSAATKHYYRCTGWVLKALDLKVGENAPWVATLTFECGVIAAPVTVDPGIGIGSREAKSAIVDTIKHFASGAVTMDAAAWAILVGGLSVKFENDVGVKRTMGQKDPVNTLTQSATRRISGSVDLSLDDGAKAQWDRVVAAAAHTIAIPFGGTGQQLLTLTGVSFPSIEVESNTDDDVLMGSQDFTATGYTRGLVP